MFRITFYHLFRNKRTTILMVLALTVTFYFPLLSNALSRVLYRQMMLRAEETPLIVVAKGSRFLSVLNTIYLQSETLDPLPMRVFHDLQRNRNLMAIPIYNVFTAKVQFDNTFQSVPIVATNHDYLHFRGLRPREGAFFFFPGEVVIGHKLARQAGLRVGDTFLSEVSNLINLNAVYPLSLKVTGILQKTGTEDDGMIFSDLKSGWIMAGHFHGHGSPAELGADYILSEDANVTVMRRNVITYTEVTEENLRSFHFHGNPDDLPLTAIIVIPNDERTAVITAGRINAQGQFSAYRPDIVMEEFFGIVFAINKIFNTYFLLVMSAVACFITIIILLSVRLRRDEFCTIKTLGGSRFVVYKLLMCEYGILLVSSLLVAALLTWQTLVLLRHMFI
jgi:putative ABC transport system permease protein